MGESYVFEVESANRGIFCAFDNDELLATRGDEGAGVRILIGSSLIGEESLPSGCESTVV